MLRLINVWYRYKEDWVLKGINLICKKGHFVGILGPNGVGKTTLLYLMAGILLPQRGEILFETIPLRKIPPQERAKKIALLPQLNHFIFPLKVEEVVRLGRLPYISPFSSFKSKDKLAIEKAMELVGIADLKGRSISSLSGGERQQVLLARALAQEPEILLLDEPTTYLDVKHQIKFLSLLKELQKKKELTIIFVSHDLNLAIKFSDIVVFLKKGQIYCQGIPLEVVKPEVVEAVFNVKVKVIHSKGNCPYVVI
ncbi:MAG: ABC transporter ATP-binding protein [Candidatus Desulfofervidus auxilii]|nr:ABC transporter ATP-binding protein [Candidatus Desulfofervidus auxilii]